MKRFLLLTPLLLAACGAHFDPCVKPCPEGFPPHLCECKPYDGGGSFDALTVTPAPVTPPVTSEPPKPDPKPEPPKPPVKPEPPKEHPKPPHSKPQEPKEGGDVC